MTKPNNSKTNRIWLSVLILLLCVTTTTIAFLGRLDSYLLDDEGAIDLIAEQPSGTNSVPDHSNDATSASDTISLPPVAEQRPAHDSSTSQFPANPSPSVSAPQSDTPSKKPSFEASDGSTVWSTDTQVEIFRVSYENGEQIVTVNSGNGDKVIAPGTKNSYTFKLKNTGDVALDYTVEVDAFFSPADTEIPIQGRLNRYDGEWVIGSKDEYATVAVLDTAMDKATLGAGKYTYYTLDWLWPFESGDDTLDTMLGNLASEQDLTFTIVIRTTATEGSDPFDDSGITPPKTGDDSNLDLWIVLAIGSFAMIVFLLFRQNKEKRIDSAEAD